MFRKIHTARAPALCRAPNRQRLFVWVLAAAAAPGVSQARAQATGQATVFELKPKAIQTIVSHLQAGQLQRIQLHLEGGIQSVQEISPTGKRRPLWIIDLGRGAQLTYVLGGGGAGDYHLELRSFEQEKIAKISVELQSPSPADESTSRLREAEDLLANADLVRRHSKEVPAGLDAIKAYDAALSIARSLSDTQLIRYILTEKSRYLLFQKNDFTAARELLLQTVALPAANDPATQALAWKTLSTAYYDLSDYQSAIHAGQNAADIYHQTNDLYWQGIVLGNLSAVYAGTGQNTQALATIQEALADAKAEHDFAGVVFCLSQLAELSRQQGDIQAAFHAFHEGIDWIDRLAYAPLVEAEIQKDLGLFYAEIDDWPQATRALRRCLALEGKHTDPISLEARGLLATVMQHQGHLREAIAEDSSAIEMAASLSLKHEQTQLLLNRASTRLALGDRPLAEADIQAARKLATDTAALPLQIEATLAWADAHLPGNAVEADTVEADAAYTRALQLAQENGEREQQSVALAGLARAQQGEGKLLAAAASIEAALKILEASRSTLASRDLQVTYFALHHRWYELAVDLSLQLEKQHPGQDYAARAFAYTERARARTLLDTLDTSGYSSMVPTPIELRERYARHLQQVAAQQSLLGKSTDRTRQAAAEKLQQLYAEQDDLEAQLRAVDGRVNTLLGGQTTDIATVQRSLVDRDSVLLSYWIGAAHSYRWTVTSSSVTIDELPPRSQIEHAVVPMVRLLRARHPAMASGETIASYTANLRTYQQQLRTSLDRAGSLLLQNIPATARNVFLVSDSPLRSVPFAALRIQDGGQKSYALSKYVFFLEPSASVAVHLKQSPAADRSNSAAQALRIALFADPVLSSSDVRLAKGQKSLLAKDESLFFKMQRLTGTGEEARQITHIAPHGTVELRTGFAANPAQVRSLVAGDASILHFATHTVTIAEHPEISGIALSAFSRAGTPQDGVFWLKDIYALHLPMSLVVLSGCRTSLADDSPGEAIDSLAHAFFFSGVHSVVGSLWDVDDDATSRLMKSFYSNLLVKHQPAGEALRSAQLTLLADPQTSSPSLWAAFVMNGWPSSYPNGTPTAASSASLQDFSHAASHHR